VGSRVVKQGAIRVLEKAMHTITGFNNISIREKALYAYAWLSRIPDSKAIICTQALLDGSNNSYN